MALRNRIRLRRHAVLATTLAALAVRSQIASGQTTSPSDISQLKAEINALQSQVNNLEAKQQHTAAQNLVVEQQVLADSERQSQLLEPNALLSEYDPTVGFVIRSPDGAFSFHPGLLFDFREMTSYRAETPAPNGTTDLHKTGYDTQSGFDVTRMRLTFDGNFGKGLTYFVQFQDDQGSTFNLYDAYGTLRVGDSPFSVRFGQFKDPLYHERMMSEVNLLAVDRTETESFFGGGNTSRVQGVDLIYNQDRLRTNLAVHDGYNSINTKFFDSSSASASPAGSALPVAPNFGTTGRAEYAIIGQPSSQFSPFKEYDGGFSALGDTHDILVAGSGADYTEAGSNYALFHTVDLQYDSADGLSLYGAYLGSYRNLTTGGTLSAAAKPSPAITYAKGHYYDPGFVGQIGYLITSKIEPFARYDYTYLQGGSITGLKKQDVQEITAGVNYYLFKQHAKFTIDGVYLPDGAPVDNDAFGILQDSGHNEFVLRFQFQLSL